MADMLLLRMIITLIGAFSVRVSAQSSFGGRFGDTQDHDLLHAIQIPPKNSKTQFETGADGFPAYILKSGSDVKSPYRLFIPERLYPEFGISAVVKPLNNEGGFLFSVVNPLEMVVQLGIEIIPSGHMLNNITLYYTDVNIYSTSQKIASFVVPTMYKKWTMFSLRVLAENVTLFLNCIKYEVVEVKRIPLELIFDSASTLYLGQAGPLIKGHFEGSFQELKLFGDPSQAEVQCADSKSLAESDLLEDEELSVIFESDKDIGSGLSPDDEDTIYIDSGDKTDRYYEGSGIDDPTAPPPMIPPFPGMIKGEKGEKGQKGSHGETVRGADGPPGKPGPPGPPGPPGIPGSGMSMTFASEFSNGDGGSGDDRIIGEGFIPTGKCTCNITEIMKSFTMPETLQGPQGPPGADGRTGSPGLTGQPGVPGERGPSGPRGERGERGDQGTPGPEGPIGPKGQPGLDGRPGVPGAPGPPGPPAPVDHTIGDESVFGTGFESGVRRPGTPGPKGEPGPLGPQGIQGEKGFTGHKGERGDLGPKGHKGERGHQGPMGLSGMKGERGPSGLDGLPGQPGANGRPADKGEKGERGPEGKPGPPGPPGPISVKYTSDEGEMFDPGLSSPPGTFVGGSIGPEGPKGEQGPVGPKGEKGSSGIDGVPGFPGTDGKSGERGQIGPSGLPGMEGPQGPPGTKGERGERGPPGPVSSSAGNADYVTIKGEKGDMGLRGRRGKPGVSGPTGPPGKPGTPGGVGAPGWIGRPGFSGLPGLPGTKGDKGEPGSSSMFGYGSGQKGDKGDRGNDGIPGSPGTDGVDGRPGPPGLPGPPGSSASGVSEDGAVHFVPVPGPPGPPGPPGIPGLSVTGPKGEPGMFKSPVYGDTSYNARQTAKSPLDELKALKDQKDLKNFRDSVTNEPPNYARRSTPSPDDDSARIVPGAVTFQNTETMKKMSTSSPVGTLAYIIDEEALLVRVTNGWQYIALGSVLPITSQAPPTTTPPQARPPFEASNLINNVPVPVEGPKLRMAALNVPMTGDMHGVRGADYDCYRQARRAGLRGTFRAFLSSRVQNIDSIVRWADRDLPVVNTRGDVLFNSWGELFDGAGGIFAQSPRIYSFNGKNILTDDSWPQKVVWHGSNPQGERMMDTYCDAWHSSSSDKVGLASSLMGHKLLSQERHPCNSQFALLCIEATSQTSQRRRRDLNSFNETNFDDLLSPDDYQDYLLELQSENSN